MHPYFTSVKRVFFPPLVGGEKIGVWKVKLLPHPPCRPTRQLPSPSPGALPGMPLSRAGLQRSQCWGSSKAARVGRGPWVAKRWPGQLPFRRVRSRARGPVGLFALSAFVAACPPWYSLPCCPPPSNPLAQGSFLKQVRASPPGSLPMTLVALAMGTKPRTLSSMVNSHSRPWPARKQ